MGLFSLFKTKDPKDHFRETKTIKLNGVRFKIRRINMEDHLSGLQVLLKLYDTYKVKKPESKSTQVEDEKTVRKFMRDFIYAGVVYPELTIKKDDDSDKLHVNEVMSDMALAEKLCLEILKFSYGKKKLNIKR